MFVTFFFDNLPTTTSCTHLRSGSLCSYKFQAPVYGSVLLEGRRSTFFVGAPNRPDDAEFDQLQD
jgi:hypothetical protein